MSMFLHSNLSTFLNKFRQFTTYEVPFSLHFFSNLTQAKILLSQFLKRTWTKYLFLNDFCTRLGTFEARGSFIEGTFFPLSMLPDHCTLGAPELQKIKDQSSSF